MEQKWVRPYVSLILNPFKNKNFALLIRDWLLKIVKNDALIEYYFNP